MSIKKELDLAGKVAVVTGGSRGLGLAMAQALGEMGARPVIIARKQDELDEARAQLAERDITAVSYRCDLGQREQIAPLVDRILQEHGRVDILVNNAAATWAAPAEDHPIEAWDKLVALNLTGTFLLTQRIGKRSMIPNGYGRIVNIASIGGLMGQDPNIVRSIAYCTTKGGIVNFTRALAAEWAQFGITVNAICPGFIPTKMSRGRLDAVGETLLARTPSRKLGEETDLNGLAVLLGSAASRHITGQVIAVDGGATVV
jgi:gluconate 5-dehydrogenase